MKANQLISLPSNRIIPIALTLSLFCSLHLSSNAQAIDSLIQIETVDGNQFIGRVVEQDSARITIKTAKLGQLSLQKSFIKKISPVSGALVGGEYWLANPQSSRYFFSPNGFGLKKGEGYYQNVWVLFNQVSVGITDNVTIGGGMVPLFLFGGSPTPVWLTPKVSIPIKKDHFNIGAGGLFGTVLGESKSGFGIVYGMTTFGNRNQNFSIGCGYGYSGKEFAKSPTITFSAMVRTGARGYFMTENYYIDTGSTQVVMLSVGGRRIINRVGLDFGLFLPFTSDMESLVAIPWLGVTVPFGNTKK